MLKAKPAKEVVVRFQNEVGSFNRLARIVADKGVNMLAVCSWVEHDQAVVRLLTDDHRRVVDTLASQGWQTRESDVITIELAHKPGMLHHVTGRLAEAGIDIHHLYATASASQDTSLVVFATANMDRALVVLND